MHYCKFIFVSLNNLYTDNFLRVFAPQIFQATGLKGRDAALFGKHCNNHALGLNTTYLTLYSKWNKWIYQSFSNYSRNDFRKWTNVTRK